MKSKEMFEHWYFNVYEPEKHEGEPEEYSANEMIEFAQYCLDNQPQQKEDENKS